MNIILLLVIYLVAINITAFFLFMADKKRAIRGSWRISEKTLFIVSFLGGGVGSLLSMLVFRHKTKHLSFLILIPLSIIVDGLLLFLILK